MKTLKWWILKSILNSKLWNIVDNQPSKPWIHVSIQIQLKQTRHTGSRVLQRGGLLSSKEEGGICSGFDVNNARKQQGPTVEDQFKRKLSNHSIIPFKSSLHPPLLPSLPYIPPSSPLLFTIIFLYYIYCRKPRFIIQSGLVHGFRSSLKRFPTQPYSG